MRVAVLGPGGVGGFLAGLLPDVVLLAREESAAVIAERGLRISSARLGREWTARPEVATHLDAPADVLLVCTKADGLDRALDRVRAPVGLVVPLLNGLEHVALLRGRFGERVVPAAIRISADRTAPGIIEQTSPFLRVDLAGEGVPDAGALPAELEAVGVPVRVGGTEADVLWAKLVRLNALAAVTAAIDGTLGEVRAEEAWAARLEACVRETAAVAEAAGARSTSAAAVLEEIAGVPDGFTASLQRDVHAGRPGELDAICGAVLRAAQRLDVPAPTVRELHDRIAARVGRRAMDAPDIGA